MNTYHIHITGQVQGVGFRPYVYSYAKENDLKGWVRNSVDGVHIEINSDEEKINQITQELILKAPSQSLILQHSIHQVDYTSYKDFNIVTSTDLGKADIMITPDFAMCKSCLSELHDPENRRFMYPFITCTECGPRYSIIKKLPYDRHLTSMHSFSKCPVCEEEYTNPLDRRYFSQTNSCSECKVKMSLYDHSGKLITEDDEEILNQVVTDLKESRIVGIKGIGGYILLADACSERAIRSLRKKKQRPFKPLAVMFPSLQWLEDEVWVNDLELAHYRSSQAPIVLLRKRELLKSMLCAQAIAPGLDRIGVMRPYAPIFEIILSAFGRPVIATSGNLSKSPIIYQDDKALKYLGNFADSIVTNNREIIVPQDDSVIKVSRNNISTMVRRSRGYAPGIIHNSFNFMNKNILALGADLKNTFTIYDKKNTYVSQYLGDLDSWDTQESFEHTLGHLSAMLDFKPEVVLIDLHPEYFSSRFGVNYARILESESIHKIQHHKAHLAAVLTENKLLDTLEPVLGVVWDGTGLGEDEQIWGGEFFRYEDYKMERVEHFSYFPHILGDKMTQEPRIAAFSLLTHFGMNFDFSSSLNSEEEILYKKIINQHTLSTSSVGRMFDAIAFLLGLGNANSYEGESAMRLETLAASYVMPPHHFYPPPCYDASSSKSSKFLLTHVLHAIQTGHSREYSAFLFHQLLVEIILGIAQKQRIKKITFSGGVFQNALLIDLIIDRMSGDYDLYFHKNISPNDEGISFGQLAAYAIAAKKDPLLNYELCV